MIFKVYCIQNIIDMIACDLAEGIKLKRHAQRRELIKTMRMITDELSSSQMTSLSVNFRSTRDLSNILCVFQENIYSSIKTDVSDVILHTQSQGHRIQGSLTVIHAFNNYYNVDSIGRLFGMELDALCTRHN